MVACDNWNWDAVFVCRWHGVGDRDNDEIDNDDNDIDSTRGMDMDTLYNFTYFGYSDDK